jgi:release factor glutamine methyltransferase
MMLKSALREVRSRFEGAGISAVDAEHLAAFVLGVKRMELHAREFQFSPEQETEFTELVSQRLTGVPLQYLTGVAPFRYLEFDVGPGVLVPRPETELLVDAALVEIERIQSNANFKLGDRTSVVDLGAGSGAIAISIADEARRRGLSVQVVAVEREPAAIAWLERNIAKHEVDVRVVKSDVSDALIGVRSDLVVANPPYIPDGTALPREVLDHEPATALFGGLDGVVQPLKFVATASRILKENGFLVLEHHETHGDLLEAALVEDYFEISHFDDLAGRPRWLSARRKG